MGDRHDAFAPSEGIQGTVGFWISRLGFRIPCTVHLFCWWNLFSGLQSLVRQKSGFLYIGGGGGAIHFTATAFKRNLILGDDQHECTRRGSTLTSLTVVGLLYTSIMRHAHEPNCLLTYYAVLRPFQSLLFLVLSQEGY